MLSAAVWFSFAWIPLPGLEPSGCVPEIEEMSSREEVLNPQPFLVDTCVRSAGHTKLQWTPWLDSQRLVANAISVRAVKDTAFPSEYVAKI